MKVKFICEFSECHIKIGFDSYTELISSNFQFYPAIKSYEFYYKTYCRNNNLHSGLMINTAESCWKYTYLCYSDNGSRFFENYTRQQLSFILKKLLTVADSE